MPPTTIHTLWLEYTTGIGGRKAARLFTTQERGQNKFKYSRRKVVWDTISGLIRAGLSADVACDRLYAVYGQNMSVTRIINALRHDKKTMNVHPSLQF